jgi:hypothetical protein
MSALHAKHALFVTSRRGNDTVTFRVGQPTSWDNAQDQHQATLRAQDSAAAGRRPIPRVRHMRRSYPITFAEVRATDRHGRGIGSERHATAIPVPFTAIKRAR